MKSVSITGILIIVVGSVLRSIEIILDFLYLSIRSSIWSSGRLIQ